ncbi:MAG: hypothetical protein DME83_09675 [Verrucomicrobia bacterium]|nr:MAG: hypothetical protein DME83_09675 [Verrucomicrobiota bacterium]
MFRLRCFDSIAADENSAARLRRFARSRYHLRCAGAVCANAAAHGITFSERTSAPTADYDLHWGVKFPMRDKVELITIRKTAD